MEQKYVPRAESVQPEPDSDDVEDEDDLEDSDEEQAVIVLQAVAVQAAGVRRPRHLDWCPAQNKMTCQCGRGMKYESKTRVVKDPRRWPGSAARRAAR